jgi:hypothetical protein
VGTKAVLKGIQKRFNQISHDKVGSLKPHSTNQGIYYLRVFGGNARTVFNHFKKLKVPKLQRKWSDYNGLYALDKNK